MPVISGGGGGSSTFDQDRFRFRKDDGDLTNATWAGDLNANIAWPVGENIRLRLAIQETAGVRSTNWYFRLYYRINGGTWTYASTGSYYSSPNFADEAADNVQRLGTGQTFTGGGGNESTQIGVGDWIDFNGNDEFELEFCFRVPTACVAGDTVDYQVWKSQTTTYVALNTYTRTPQIVVAGTAKGSQSGYLAGGGYPKGSISAWLQGDYPRSHVHAFLEGWRDGYSAKKAWMRGVAPKVPAYMFGAGGVKVAVIPFNARTSTGTQDITSSKLANTQPKLAMLFGCGATAYDTVTANARIFFGATDGTTSWLRYGYHLDGANPGVNSQGGDSTTYCAGFVSATGGYATFDSWLTGATPGIRINWGQAAPGAMKCCAIIIGANSDEAFQCKVGNMSWSTGLDGDIFEYDVAFKPQSIFFHTGQGGNLQQGLGIGFWDANEVLHQLVHQSGWDWTGYMDVSGGVAAASEGGIYELVMAQRTYSDTGYARYKVNSRYDTGFRIEMIANHGADDGHYIAMRYADDFQVGYWVPPLVGEYQEPDTMDVGDNVVSLPCKPQAVLHVASRMSAYNGWCTSMNCYYANGFGYSAFDDTNQECCTVNHGDSQTLWECKSVATQGFTLNYDRTQALMNKATVTDITGNQVTLNYTNSAYHIPMLIYFGGGYKTKSSQKAYMYAHWRRVNAFTKGCQHDKSSQKAFYWVVDAQDSIPAYTEGLQPSRSSVHAYMTGTGPAGVILIPFTVASGATQDITSVDVAGLTVKAALCLIYEESPTDDVHEVDTGYMGLGYGFTDGVHSYYESIYAVNDVSQPYQQGWRRGYDVGFICLTNSAGGIRLKGTFNSFITNGIRVNWTTQSAGRKGVMILFAGSSVSAMVNTFTPTGGGVTTQVTTPNFEPDFLAYAHVVNPTEQSGYGDAVDKSHSISHIHAVNNGTRDAMRAYAFLETGATWAQYCSPTGSLGIRLNQGRLYGSMNSPSPGDDGSLTIESYDATGFTVRSGPDMTTPAYPSVYLVVNFGRKLRADMGYIEVPATHTSGKHAYKLTYKNGQAVRSIVPTFAWLFGSRLSPTYWTSEGTANGLAQFITYGWSECENHLTGGWADLNGPTYGFATPSQRAGFGEQASAFCWSCEPASQFQDRVCARISNPTYSIHGYYVHPDLRVWRETTKAKIASLIENGIELEWFKNDYGPSISAWPIILFGIPVEKSKQAAYMKGQKVDWRSRTPRGAYMMGAVEGTAASTSTPAFLEGSGIPVKTSQAAYCKGQMDATGSQECFTRGSIDVKSSIPAYTVAVTPASSSIHAYTRSGTDVKSSTPAYIWSDYSRSSTPAYLEGAAAGANVSAKPAFMLGGGTFPFTDNFTGSDGSIWNDLKWETSEQ